MSSCWMGADWRSSRGNGVGIAVASRGTGDWVTSFGRSMVAIPPLCEMCVKEWLSPPRQGRWEFGRGSDGLAPETDLTAGGKMEITLTHVPRRPPLSSIHDLDWPGLELVIVSLSSQQDHHVLPGRCPTVLSTSRVARYHTVTTTRVAEPSGTNILHG